MLSLTDMGEKALLLFRMTHLSRSSTYIFIQPLVIALQLFESLIMTHPRNWITTGSI